MSIPSVSLLLSSTQWYSELMRSNTPLDDPTDMGASKQTLQTRKQDFVRDAIWTAALDLFAEKGFDETTVEDIVDAAGTSRRTFFRHFESKRDLMAQPVVSYGASITKAIDSSPARSCAAEL